MFFFQTEQTREMRLKYCRQLYMFVLRVPVPEGNYICTKKTKINYDVRRSKEYFSQLG